MSAIPQTSGWQAGFMKLLPAVQTHAKIKFRKLRVEQREEAIQETVAAACVHYQLAAAQGKLRAVRPGSLADFAVRYVRTGRHVGGVQDRSKDVLSPNCHRRYGVKLQGYPAQSCDGTDGWRQQALAEAFNAGDWGDLLGNWQGLVSPQFDFRRHSVNLPRPLLSLSCCRCRSA